MAEDNKYEKKKLLAVMLPLIKENNLYIVLTSQRVKQFAIVSYNRQQPLKNWKKNSNPLPDFRSWLMSSARRPKGGYWTKENLFLGYIRFFFTDSRGIFFYLLRGLGWEKKK